MKYLFPCLLLAIGCAKAGVDPDAGPGKDGSQTLSDARARVDARPRVDSGPPRGEVCDGLDNDGDQFIDEGDPVELCGAIDNGTPRCNGMLGCAVGECDPLYFDLDGRFDTGCECTGEAGDIAASTCAAAVDLGNFIDSSTSVQVVANIVPAGDVDYYKFRGIDSSDASCDKFHVRAVLTDNPGDAFVVDVWRGSCTGEQVCSGGTDMQWYTNFSAGGVGECPCGPTSTNRCNDNSSDFFVRVRRKDGLPLTCDNYTLEVSNGKYPAP